MMIPYCFPFVFLKVFLKIKFLFKYIMRIVIYVYYVNTIYFALNNKKKIFQFARNQVKFIKNIKMNQHPHLHKE